MSCHKKKTRQNLQLILIIKHGKLKFNNMAISNICQKETASYNNLP